MKLLALHFSQMDESNWLNCSSPAPSTMTLWPEKKLKICQWFRLNKNAPVDRLESPTADSSALQLAFQKPALSCSVVFKEGRKTTSGQRSSLKSWRVFTWNDDRWGWEIKRTITDKVLFVLFDEIFDQTCKGKDGSAFTLMEILASTLSVPHKMICSCNLNLKKKERKGNMTDSLGWHSGTSIRLVPSRFDYTTRVKSPPWHRVYPAQATRQKLLVYFCHVPAKQKPDKVSLFGRRSHADNDEANELGKSIQNESFPRLKKKTLQLHVPVLEPTSASRWANIKNIHYQITNTWHFNSFPRKHARY